MGKHIISWDNAYSHPTHLPALFSNSFLKKYVLKYLQPDCYHYLLSKKCHCNSTTAKVNKSQEKVDHSWLYTLAHKTSFRSYVTPLVPVQASLQEVVDNVAPHVATIFGIETTQMELLLWSTTLESYCPDDWKILAWCRRTGLHFRRQSLHEVVIPE